jgi:broad specificity phosphatase PhoE
MCAVVRYIGLRHGQSEANVLGVISSNPAVGTVTHRLTDLGKAQARASASELLKELGFDGKELDEEQWAEDLVFVSSDFTRAYETAKFCIEELEKIFSDVDDSDNAQSSYPIQIRKELRERYFGSYDAKELIFYNRVWTLDTINADNTERSVESVNQVIHRISGLIQDLEQQYEGKTIVLVSHADTLQITQSYLKGIDSRLFHQYRFKNGEVRDFLCLPDPVEIQYT